MRLALPIGAALFAASTALFAQTGAPADDKARHRQARDMCAQAKDPKACHERMAKGKEAFAAARKACEGKPDAERRECMRREVCAKAKDPARCETHAREAAAAREKAHQACKDKPADERRACMREQLGRKPRA